MEDGAVGYGDPVGQGGLHAGRQLGIQHLPVVGVDEVFPGPGSPSRLSVKDQRVKEEEKLRGPHNLLSRTPSSD